MPKVWYVIKDLDMDEGVPRIIYNVVAPESSLPRYGCDFPLDKAKTLTENITALTQKIATEVSVRGSRVTVDDVAPVGLDNVVEADAVEERGLLARAWDSMKSMVTG